MAIGILWSPPEGSCFSHQEKKQTKAMAQYPERQKPVDERFSLLFLP
jgi:hypothetical protein